MLLETGSAPQTRPAVARSVPSGGSSPSLPTRDRHILQGSGAPLYPGAPVAFPQPTAAASEHSCVGLFSVCTSQKTQPRLLCDAIVSEHGLSGDSENSHILVLRHISQLPHRDPHSCSQRKENRGRQARRCALWALLTLRSLTRPRTSCPSTPTVVPAPEHS